MPSDLPEAIDGMKVLRRLGEGGMGQVYACQEPDSETVVAVKVLLPELANDEEMRQRFLREAKALTAVSSPHVVKATRTGEADGGPYLVMELLEGETLRDRIMKDSPLPLDDAIRWAKEAALGLRAAQEAGIVHRDVKPENLFLTDEGVKVVDFGLARPLDGSGNLTAAGMIVGSPAYVAPERSRGEDATVKSDLYALGATIFELLAGRPPYGGETEVEVLTAHLTEELPDIQKLRPEVSDELKELLERMLEKEPEQRVGAYNAVLNVLERIPLAAPAPPTAPTEKEEPAPTVKKIDIDPAPRAQTRDLGATLVATGAHPVKVWLEATRQLLGWATSGLRSRAFELWRNHRGPTLAGLGVLGLMVLLFIIAVLPDKKEGKDPGKEAASAQEYPEDDIRGWNIKELVAFLGDDDIDDIIAELEKRPADDLEGPLAKLIEEGSYIRRHRALQILETVDRATPELRQRVAIRDIENGPTCAAREEGVEMLLENAVDEDALAAIEHLKRRRRANGCMDLAEIERELREKLN